MRSRCPLCEVLYVVVSSNTWKGAWWQNSTIKAVRWLRQGEIVCLNVC